MDVNAGAYLDGTPMEQLTLEMFELTLKIASGTRSKGERAGHAQVSIWRNWKQTSVPTSELFKGSHFSGQGLTLKDGRPSFCGLFKALRRNGRRTSDQVGLILPTSLCASQIAKMSAEQLNLKGLGRNRHVSRFVSLLHTEGCGHSGGVTEEMYSRTMLGYLNHPLVGFALLLEHGCEKMHNDYMRHQAEQQGVDLSHHGWASVQLDGGIERVLHKIEGWFEETITHTPAPSIEETGLEGLRLGLMASGPVPRSVAELIGDMAFTVCAAGGTIVVPHNSPLLSQQAFLACTLGSASPEPSLDYGQRAASAGLHIMETPTDHWIETLTGMGATGVEMFIAHIGDRPQQGHPLVPLLQCSGDPVVLASHAEDLDLSLIGDPASWNDALLRLVLKLASREYFPKTLLQGNHDFQLTRGLVGVSL